MKLIFRLFLSLSFLLLSGYNCIYAEPYQGNDHSISKLLLTTSRHHTHLITGQLVAKHTIDDLKRKRCRIFAEETDENYIELDVSKIRIAVSNYFSTFYSLLSGYFSHKLNHRSLFHLSCYSSCKCIILQVFKI